MKKKIKQSSFFVEQLLGHAIIPLVYADIYWR